RALRHVHCRVPSVPAIQFHIAGAFAELEREIIRERVKAGLANAKRRGRRVGRPRAIVSMTNGHEMAENGLSARAIAKAIGVSDYTVRKILRRCEKPPLPKPLQTHQGFRAFRQPDAPPA